MELREVCLEEIRRGNLRIWEPGGFNSAEKWLAMKSDPAEHGYHNCQRRTWYRRTVGVNHCLDCNKPLKNRHAQRCKEHRLAHENKVARARWALLNGKPLECPDCKAPSEYRVLCPACKKQHRIEISRRYMRRVKNVQHPRKP